MDFHGDSNWPTFGNFIGLSDVGTVHKTTPPKLIWMDLWHANEMAVVVSESPLRGISSSMFYLIFFECVFAVLIVQKFLEAWNWRAGHLKSQWSQIILSSEWVEAFWQGGTVDEKVRGGLKWLRVNLKTLVGILAICSTSTVEATPSTTKDSDKRHVFLLEDRSSFCDLVVVDFCS